MITLLVSFKEIKLQLSTSDDLQTDKKFFKIKICESLVTRYRSVTVILFLILSSISLITLSVN